MFVAGDLAGYLAGLRRLRALALEVICPGHGPPVWEPRREAGRLRRPTGSTASGGSLAALADGLRDEDDLLDRVWDDAPAAVRPAAALTLAAHLEKLRAEGRL